MAADTGLLRLSVVGAGRRADVVAPGEVPVAELLPGLARELGPAAVDLLADPLELHALDGRRLDGAAALAAQGVADGEVLALVVRREAPPRRHDDLATVVGEVVEGELPHPDPVGRGQALLLVGLLVLTLAAATLPTLPPPAASLTAAAAMGLLLVVGRAARGLRGVVVVWSGIGFAVVAGALTPLGPLVGGGAGAVVGGLAGVGLLGRRRGGVVAAVVAGVPVAAAGLALLAWPAASAAVPVSLLALVVLAGEALPWVAASASGLAPARLGEEPPADGLDRPRVALRVRTSHEVLAILTVGAGLVLAVAAPLSVASSGWGAALALDGCAVVLLRARRHRVAATAAAAVAGPCAALLATATAILWWHPVVRPPVVVALVALGVLLLVLSGRPPTGSVRAGRLAELLETVALVSLPPLALVASGVLDTAQGLVG